MKKLHLFVLLLCAITYTLSAQQIAYIIPDIGAPAMNTYVEIIAPYDAVNNFGNDGFYLNNPNDNIRIELMRPADSAKIVFGPLVVSWNGRLISSHAFVFPNVNPNSDYWENLRNEYRIPFRVYVNGTYTNIDTFYIVRPYDLGDISANSERMLGAGSLGRRSRRGAMIVTSTVLANANYSVSMIDCDPYTEGNQAYLPFVLLSKGTIVGAGVNTKINANGVGKNGGPGGGGGGGNFCDAYIFNPNIIGQNGGGGFTGGGPGGRNNSGGGSADEFKSPGEGTGSNGSSLNGIPYAAPSSYEASGGGTGHPFGSSGESCGDGYNCEPAGGYGGGSGYQQNKTGGSAGFRTEGNSTGSDNGGKVHGNKDGIPLAGGSGGASGNPQSPGSCSGVGGGGGGAVRIVAARILRVSVNVNGADGTSASHGSGGAGSGGYAEIGGKLAVLNCNLSAVGGNNGKGGRGLIRVDVPSALGLNYQPSGVEVGKVLTTDTTQTVYRDFTITGSKNNEIDSLRLYIKSENGIWKLDTVLTGLKNRTTWKKEYRLKGIDSIYFITAVADRQSSYTEQHSSILQYTMSQAAANIILKNKLPEIESDTVIRLRMLACPGNVIDDTIKIRNVGDADLRLDFQSAVFAGNSGFSLLSPKDERRVAPADSIDVIIRYEYQGGQYHTVRDTLYLSHNDILADNQPWKIAFEVVFDTVSFYIGNTSLSQIQTLDFGTFCYPDTIDKEFSIVNQSGMQIKVEQLQLNSPVFTQIGNLSSTLAIGGHSEHSIRFIPERAGVFTARLIVVSDTCDAIRDTILLQGEAISGEYTYEKPLNFGIDTLFLGKHCVGGTISTQFLIRNLGNQNLTLPPKQDFDTHNYKITSRSKGFVWKNGWDTVYIEFWPLKEGPIEAKYFVSTNECDGFTDTLIIKCTGIYADLSYSGNGNFGAISNETRDTLTTWLTNKGSADIYIASLKPVSPPFRYIYIDPSPPLLLRSMDSIRIDLEFYPETDGVYYDTVRTTEILFDTTCTDDESYPIQGISTDSELILTTDTLDFGVLEFCNVAQDSLQITNPTSVEVKLSNPHIVGPNYAYFEISQEPLSPIIPVGGSVWYYIKFKPRKGPAGIKVAQFVVETDFPKNPTMTVELRGEQENLKINMTPPDFTFGSVPIGVQREQTVRLTNNGKIPQNLIDVKLSNPDMTVFPVAAFLGANGGFADIKVTYKPTTAGNADTEILFIFRQNCTDSIKTNIYASGREGQILVTPRIIFDLNPPCANVYDTNMVIVNTGASQVIIDSMVIVGPDRNLFGFADTVTTPVTLDSAATVKRIMIFSPGISSYGIKTAQVITYVNVGGKTKTDTTQLRAEKRKFITISPQIIDFGNVIIGRSKDMDYTVTNTGNSRVVITGALQPAYVEFLLIPDPFGTTLDPGQSATFRVRFSPTVNSIYNDRFGLEAIYITDCKDSTFADLTGIGIPPINTKFIIGEVNDVDPRLYSIEIPVRAYITSPVAEVDDLGFTAMISYNATLFALKSISGATILKDSIFNDIRFVEFELNGIALNNDTAIITNLIGRPLLGNAESTPINWVDFNWDNAVAFGVVDTIPGALSIRVCKAGGSRLLNPGLPLTLSVAPNPASNEISISVTLLEVGRHTVDIYDVQGRATNIRNIDVSLDSEKEIEFKYNISELSSGFYFIVVTSPTNKIVKPIYIVK